MPLQAAGFSSPFDSSNLSRLLRELQIQSELGIFGGRDREFDSGQETPLFKRLQAAALRLRAGEQGVRRRQQSLTRAGRGAARQLGALTPPAVSRGVAEFDPGQSSSLVALRDRQQVAEQRAKQSTGLARSGPIFKVQRDLLFKREAEGVISGRPANVRVLQEAPAQLPKALRATRVHDDKPQATPVSPTQARNIEASQVRRARQVAEFDARSVQGTGNLQARRVQDRQIETGDLVRTARASRLAGRAAVDRSETRFAAGQERRANAEKRVADLQPTVQRDTQARMHSEMAELSQRVRSFADAESSLPDFERRYPTIDPLTIRRSLAGFFTGRNTNQFDFLDSDPTPDRAGETNDDLTVAFPDGRAVTFPTLAAADEARAELGQ